MGGAGAGGGGSDSAHYHPHHLSLYTAPHIGTYTFRVQYWLDFHCHPEEPFLGSHPTI